MGSIKDIEYSTGGNHNIENALAATALSLVNNVRGYEIKEGLRTFSGVVRRFDIQIKSDNIIYIDDYAHHPSEIKAFLSAVKQIYPDRKITAIFQPHLFSRTKDFYLEFANSLSIADDLLLLPIYPAREKPIKGINSKIILENVKHENKQLIEKKNLISILKSKEPELIVTMGAGDIDQFVSQIKKEFS